MPYAPADYFDLCHAPGPAVFPPDQPVWEAIARIAATLDAFDWINARAASPGSPGVSAHAHLGERIHLGAGSRVEPGATIKGPAWIGENCEIRSGAYLRENVIVGNNAVLGNSCEFKNCILFDDADVPHFSYVGDSILGYKAHLGAGAILSNVRLDKRNIRIPESPGSAATVDTGLRKFGAIVGDHAEIGCNSVISPGSILGRNSLIYPGTHWRGVLPADTIVKLMQEHVLHERRK